VGIRSQRLEISTCILSMRPVNLISIHEYCLYIMVIMRWNAALPLVA